MLERSRRSCLPVICLAMRRAQACFKPCEFSGSNVNLFCLSQGGGRSANMTRAKTKNRTPNMVRGPRGKTSVSSTHLNVRKHFLRQGGNEAARFVLLHQLEKWRIDHCHLHRRDMEKRDKRFALCRQEHHGNRASWCNWATWTAIGLCNRMLSSGIFLPQPPLLAHLLRVINAIARSFVTVQDSLS